MTDTFAPPAPSDARVPSPSLPAPQAAPATEATPPLPAPTLPTPTAPAAAPFAPALAPAPIAAPAPSLPTLAQAAPAPSLPALAPAAPAPPMPVMTAPIAYHPPVVQETAPVSAAEMFAEPAVEVEEEPVAEQRPIINTRWLRIIAIAGCAVIPLTNWAIAAALPLAAVAVWVVPVLALVLWSGLTVVNVGRARPATRHQSPPRPIWAAGSWLLAPILAIPGVVLLYRLDEWSEAGSFDQESQRSIMFYGAVLAFAVIMLWALTRPYMALARASQWVSGDSTKFRGWFFKPLLVFAGGVVIAILVALATAANSSLGDTSAGPSNVATGVAIAAVVLPWLTWLVLGTKAMIDIEEAIGHQHRRRSVEEPAVTPMNPLMAAQTSAESAASNSL